MFHVAKAFQETYSIRFEDETKYLFIYIINYR